MVMIPIRYRDFYDVPRVFAVVHSDEVYLFDCPFDEAADEYPTLYEVYRLLPGSEHLLEEAAWPAAAALGEPVGRVDVARVVFDESKRATVDDAVFSLL